MAFGDFDNDGDMDILIMNINEPPSLLRNDASGGGHWLKVKLVGTKSNRSAIGATVMYTAKAAGRLRPLPRSRAICRLTTGGCTLAWERHSQPIWKSGGRVDCESR